MDTLTDPLELRGRMPESTEPSSILRTSDTQALALDHRLATSDRPMDRTTRDRIWTTVERVLDHGPGGAEDTSVGVLLGRVQSGKTTAMTGLAALSHDRGYRLTIAVLGSTNLLLTQNTQRFLAGLGLSHGLTSDYVWVHLDAAGEGARLGSEVQHALGSGRSVLITVLKNAARLRSLASQLDRLRLDDVSALVLDDEADQGSLNTLVSQGSSSPTYSAIGDLMAALPRHLYVQVTATPFAPLLLEPSDYLSPRWVEVLEPGPGYTGVREFFVERGEAVVRLVGASENMTSPPRMLPPGLVTALANYLVGAALLLANDPAAAPVSMLVHPTHRVSVHQRVETLLRREVNRLRDQLVANGGEVQLPPAYASALQDLLQHGVPPVPMERLVEALRDVTRLVKISVVNSIADQNTISWSSSPAHILVGGNKLDRGFTVEGLTVSYLSRAASTQADTLAQRARAFGYRGTYLPYCRFFGSSATVDAFKASVLTEEAMRRELLAWVAEGHPLSEWGARVGFLLGDGLRPTRNPVAPGVTRSLARGWHVLARPELDADVRAHNAGLVEQLGILDAPREPYGRLAFRTLWNVDVGSLSTWLSSWAMSDRSGWSSTDVVGFVQRIADLQPELALDVVLLDNASDGGPRVRSWRPGLGFSNLMQGRDNNFVAGTGQYAGDRAMFGDRSGLQIHWLRGRADEAPSTFTLALHIGTDITAAMEARRR